MAILDKVFEDKQPTNFVEQASGGYTPLEEFFLKKSNNVPKSPPKPEVKIAPTSKAAKKVSDEDLQSIKKLVAPETQTNAAPTSEPTPEFVNTKMQSEVPMEYSQEVTNTIKPLIDPAEINRQVEELSKNQGGWSDYLPALVPLIAEALAGPGANYAGSQIAGEYLLKTGTANKQRERELQNKLLEIAKAKSLRKMLPSQLQSKSLIDLNTGRRFGGSYDPRSGSYFDDAGNRLEPGTFQISSGLTTPEYQQRQEISSDIQISRTRELGKDLRPDPTTGLLSRWENGRLVPVQTPVGLLNPTQKKDLDGITGKLFSSDSFKKPIASMQAVSNIKSLIADANSGNPVAAEMARSELAKIAEGGSRLSDQDVNRIGGDRSLKTQARRYVNLQRTGQPLLPKDIAFFEQIADTLYKVNRLKVMDVVGGLEKSFIQKGGVPGAVQTAILPYIPASPQARTTKSVPTKQGKKSPPPGMTFEQFKKWKQANE